jgi:hypothetical protein
MIVNIFDKYDLFRKKRFRVAIYLNDCCRSARAPCKLDPDPVFAFRLAASNLKCNTVSYKVLRCTKEPSTSNYNLKSA